MQRSCCNISVDCLGHRRPPIFPNQSIEKTAHLQPLGQKMAKRPLFSSLTRRCTSVGIALNGGHKLNGRGAFFFTHRRVLGLSFFSGVATASRRYTIREKKRSVQYIFCASSTTIIRLSCVVKSSKRPAIVLTSDVRNRTRVATLLCLRRPTSV